MTSVDKIETYFNFEDDTNFRFPYKCFRIASFMRFVYIHEETDRFLVIYCKKSLFSIKIVRTKLKTRWDNGNPSETSDDNVALTSLMHLLLCACHKSVLMIKPNRSTCIILCVCVCVWCVHMKQVIHMSIERSWASIGKRCRLHLVNS